MPRVIESLQTSHPYAMFRQNETQVLYTEQPRSGKGLLETFRTNTHTGIRVVAMHSLDWV